MTKDGNYEQWLYYRELRLDRLRKMYMDGMWSLKGFDYSSTGIALAEQMRELEKDLLAPPLT